MRNTKFFVITSIICTTMMRLGKPFSSSGSTLFVHLTGGGKSYVALQCILYFVRGRKISSVTVLGQNNGVLHTWKKLFSDKSDKLPVPRASGGDPCLDITIPE